MTYQCAASSRSARRQDTSPAGNALLCVILDDRGAVVGRITLNGIVRGAFQSCSVGYWLGASACGRGMASATLRDIKAAAFGELGLHRIQAKRCSAISRRSESSSATDSFASAWHRRRAQSKVPSRLASVAISPARCAQAFAVRMSHSDAGARRT
ncbi:MAG TPA: GNAT family protein [Streptosporangiaceae bacterium]|nr:GNAT family protein [Streptosporangiaceae bacterium]